MINSIINTLEEVGNKILDKNELKKELQFQLKQGLDIAKKLIKDSYKESISEHPVETIESLTESIINEHGSYLTIEYLEYYIDKLKIKYEYDKLND